MTMRKNKGISTWTGARYSEDLEFIHARREALNFVITKLRELQIARMDFLIKCFVIGHPLRALLEPI